MTDEELKKLVAGLAVAQAETGRQIKALTESQRETERVLTRTDDLLAAQAETGRQIEALTESQRETERVLTRTDRLLADLAEKWERERHELRRELRGLARQSDRDQRELRKEIGGLTNKFGGFTEGLALPSMERILAEKFKMEVIAPNLRKRRQGRSFEVDVMAYANTHTNAVYLVEVKSRLREEGIEQMLQILGDFFDFFPEHRGKDLYGILAVVDAPDHLRAQVLRQGLYLARIADDVFDLQVPEGFQPRSFTPAA